MMDALHVHVIRAVNIKNREIAGKSDPFVTVYFGESQTLATKVIEDNLNPEWNETLTFDLKGRPLTHSDVLKLTVLDHDVITPHKFLGKLEIPLTELAIGKTDVLSINTMLKNKKGAETTSTIELSIRYETSQKVKPAMEISQSKSATIDQDVDDDKEQDYIEPTVSAGVMSKFTEKQPVQLSGSLIKSGQSKSIKHSNKPQDFQVRVKVIECRQLVGSNISPICKVTCWKESQETKVRSSTNSPYWDQLFFFNFRESPATLLEQELQFYVLNSRHLRTDALIGSFRFDLGLVYESEKHAIMNKWLLLCDPEDPMSGPKGYLKISVVVLGPGDEAPSMKVTEEHDKEDIEGNLLRPSGVQLRPAALKIRLYMAEDLPRMDTDVFKGIKKLLPSDSGGSFVDPYCLLSFAGKSVKSSIKERTDHPEWNEEMTLNIQFPSMCDKVNLTFFDWDRITKNDPIGSGALYLSQTSVLRADGYGFLPTFGPCFVNLYGSPREFSVIPDKFEALNLGKGEGVAYRGRVMLEMNTELLNEPTTDSVKPIDPDTVIRLQKFLRRRKYILYAGFLSATLIEEKMSGPIEFEVSIGNYGNKLDDSAPPCASTTPPTNAVSDGASYFYLPWGEDKPCTMVEAQFEDISYRLHAVNMLQKIVERLETGVKLTNLSVEAHLPEEEQAQTAIGALDEFISGCIAADLPQWTPENSPKNDMDQFLFKYREEQMNLLKQQAEFTRTSVATINDALIELESYSESIQNLTREPQNSVPDIIIWMLVSGKRIAYHRIPANEVLYHEDERYIGSKCGIPQTITLKRPKLLQDNAESEWKIPCQLRVLFWLGLEKDESAWHECFAECKMKIVAETYENQASIMGKWVTNRPPLTRPPWTDNTGRIDLPKDAIAPPCDWQWEGDWYVSPEISLLYQKDAGKSNYVEEVFYNQSRSAVTSWADDAQLYTDAQGEPKQSPADSELPDGWSWVCDWQVDYNRPCDEEGFEYSIQQYDDGYVAAEKLYHMYRRKRLIRKRVLGDAAMPFKREILKQILSGRRESQLSLLDSLVTEPVQSWEYAFNFDSKFHTKAKLSDNVRRRRWHRALEARDKENPPTGLCLLQIKTAAKQAKENLTVPRIFLHYESSHTWHLRVYIYQARGLLAADQSGLSDPFVRCCFQGFSQETQIVQKSLCPTWDETLIFDQVEIHGHPMSISCHPPPVILELFDYDQFTTSEYLGRLQHHPFVALEPEEQQSAFLSWMNFQKAGRVTGELLVGFELILLDSKSAPTPPPRRDQRYIVPEGIRPEIRRTGIEILCWGVRNMRKFQLGNVTSPFIEFEIGGKTVKSSVIKNTKRNPNFPSPVLFMDVKLPLERLYIPPMKIYVRDNRAFGQQPIVGMHILKKLEDYQVKPRLSQLDTTIDLQVLLEGSTTIQSTNIVDPLLRKDSKAQCKTRKKYLDLEQLDSTVDWWSKFYASMGEFDKCLNYFDLGYDTLQVYDCALEELECFSNFSDFCSTFTLTRGKNLDDEQDSFAGEFKGSFRVYELPEDPDAPLPLPYYDSSTLLSAPQECIVRVYLIRAYDLQPADASGLADPYVEIKLGPHKVSSRDTYVPNTLSPCFGRMLQLKCILPVEKDLHVIVKDYDLVGSDDLIGETHIDLENRLLTKHRATCGLPQSYCVTGPNQWRDCNLPSEILASVCEKFQLPPIQYEEQKNGKETLTCRVAHRLFSLEDFERTPHTNPHLGPPKERLALAILNILPLVKEHVETRKLYSPLQPNIEQGSLQMWVDIFPCAMGNPGPVRDIAPRKPEEYVLRLIVWNTTDVVLQETSITGEKMSDIYVKAWISGLDDKQETDVHYRSLDGEGNFNWRFIFPFDYIPAENMIVVERKDHVFALDKTKQQLPPLLIVQIWDNDKFSADDFLGTLEINLSAMPNPAKSSSKCELSLLRTVGSENKLTNLFESKRAKGFWPFMNDEGGSPTLTGKIEMELEIVTKSEAQLRPAGVGRDEPNENPHLEPPQRPETSFFWFTSPWKTFKFIIWKRMKCILIAVLVFVLIGLLLALFVYALPSLLARKLVGV